MAFKSFWFGLGLAFGTDWLFVDLRFSVFFVLGVRFPVWSSVYSRQVQFV